MIAYPGTIIGGRDDRDRSPSDYLSRLVRTEDPADYRRIAWQVYRAEQTWTIRQRNWWRPCPYRPPKAVMHAGTERRLNQVQQAVTEAAAREGR